MMVKIFLYTQDDINDNIYLSVYIETHFCYCTRRCIMTTKLSVIQEDI